MNGVEYLKVEVKVSGKVGKVRMGKVRYSKIM